MAILGDREQTLELHQFDWTRVPNHAGKSLYDMAMSASQSNFETFWDFENGIIDWAAPTYQTRSKTDLRYFHEVHRNVPIVDLMRWSFQNAAKPSEIEHLFSIPEGGTASITTNQKR